MCAVNISSHYCYLKLVSHSFACLSALGTETMIVATACALSLSLLCVPVSLRVYKCVCE